MVPLSQGEQGQWEYLGVAPPLPAPPPSSPRFPCQSHGRTALPLEAGGWACHPAQGAVCGGPSTVQCPRGASESHQVSKLLLWAVIKPRLPFSICVVTLSFQLIYLKIAGMLFPTSDFWHPVVTPALVCMSQLLTKVRPTGSQAGRSI